jgi:hypothetical protein
VPGRHDSLKRKAISRTPSSNWRERRNYGKNRVQMAFHGVNAAPVGLPVLADM